MYQLSREAFRFTHRRIRAPRSAKMFDGSVVRLFSQRYLMYVTESVAAKG